LPPHLQASTECPLLLGWTGSVEELINNQLTATERLVRELDTRGALHISSRRALCIPGSRRPRETNAMQNGGYVSASTRLPFFTNTRDLTEAECDAMIVFSPC